MSYDYLNTNIYKSAAHAYRNSLPTALTFAFILLVLEVVTPIFGLKSSMTFVGEMFLEIGMAFAVHTFILTGVSNSWKDLILVKNEAYSYKPFMWKSFAFLVMFFLVMAIIGVLTFMLGTFLVVDKKELYLGLAAILFVIIGLPLIGILFTIYGTVLPATVAEVDSSFPAAFRRSKGLFWFTFGRLAYGPTLFTVGSLIIIVVLGRSNIPVNVYGESGELGIVGTVIAFIIYAFRMFGLALMATVLCKTYFKSVALSEQPT
ncbi:hypothetical protein A9Q96_02415 [Rhodobacterales bacterium 52_120_T64]|nr:hypothetical protein A9Q96_02415 [Rhodobacterales bacterium 52_120_T64]